MLDCTDPTDRSNAIAAAVRAVEGGSVIVLPTDTLYGVGADAFSPSAVTGVLAAKGRGRDMPVPVLVGSWQTIEGLVSYVTPPTRALIEAFWPGGLTLIVEHAPSLAWDLGDARGTVGIRMPLHPVALELLERTGPMAVSSANRTSMPPATTAQQAYDQLGESVSVYLDGGPVPIGKPSTIVDLTGDVPRLVREGAVTLAQLTEVVGVVETR
ncbi:L-threonylcarbamoyladenylate synthase [Jatrophihabitans telluris]|uniref:L-threonylcarbamoyladenylate synthase n=2 Tax=Jatrophihabitans telluris TaxID=2038343 RepID=A0ABY4R385_9ACTN|nr:L-threonylcarbamoyladenylate synthase [Jatrophihabitans telluris]UQX90290.1 L-threonylcarbamoyladenylate synthase [Jatrophihabitans telluris]